MLTGNENSKYACGIIRADSGYLGNMNVKDTLTMGNNGEILANDARIDDGGITLESTGSASSALKWTHQGQDILERVGEIFVDVTSTSSQMTLQPDTQTGSRLDIVLDSDLIINKGFTANKTAQTSLGHGDQVLTVTAPTMEITSCYGDTRIVEINIAGSFSLEEGMEIKIVNNDDSDDCPLRDYRQTSHTGGNIKCSNEAFYTIKNQGTYMGLALIGGYWVAQTDAGA